VEYLPFGEVWIEETDPATGYIPFRFTSKELDEETGLYYHGARYYEPTISRWMSADPAGFALSSPNRSGYSIIEAANWYAYVSNNPVIYVDPTGMEVAVQAHAVAFGNYHLSIRITPENQEMYKGDERFKEDENGKLFLTLGAEPEKGKLVSDLNRGKDLFKKKVETVILDLEGRDEDEVIDALLSADKNYGDDAEYWLFPKEGDTKYNSNSYVSGVLRYAEVEPPDMKSNTPGYDNPLPIPEENPIPIPKEKPESGL